MGKSKFSGSISEDISNSLYETPYKLYGLTKISLYGVKNMDFYCSISDYFKMSVKSSNNFDSFGIMYIIAGKAPKQLCSQCSGQYVYDNTCVASCPAGTMKKTYKDGGVACMGKAKGYYSTMTQTSTQSSSQMQSSKYSRMQATGYQRQYKTTTTTQQKSATVPVSTKDITAQKIAVSVLNSVTAGGSTTTSTQTNTQQTQNSGMFGGAASSTVAPATVDCP